MAESLIPGRPHWELPFTEDGKRESDGPFKAFLDEAPAQCTDVLIISHGWNNDRATARDLYRRFFQELGGVLPAGTGAKKIGTAGVLWPSILWPEDSEAATFSGGAAGLGDTTAPLSDPEFLESLNAAFPGKSAELRQMAALLREQSGDEKKLEEFHQLMLSLDSHDEGTGGEEDSGEAAMVDAKPRDLFQRFDEELPGEFHGGTAGLELGSLWNGAKQAARMFTYWQMKKRAGVVGERGLGTELSELGKRTPRVRVHLIGHSFGARLVSFALGRVGEGAASNVNSLFLAQGAFSHFSFADSLPFDTGRGGALKGFTRRVAGPLCATHSRFDGAVGNAYPLASMLSRQDAAAAEDQRNRWGGIGSDGAQAVNASEAVLGRVGTVYPMATGRFTNLDGNGVIKNGSGPSGAHSDICHPEIAWALAQATGLVPQHEPSGSR